MTVSESKLWQPLQLGSIKLSHRIAMAPLTRYRNDDENVPLEMMTKYYADRACVPGTLIITEATGVSPTAEGEQHLPGVGTAKQMVQWKKIYKAVHDNKSFVFQQLWDTGRGSEPEWQKKNGFKYYSSGNLKVKGQDVAPEAMTEEDILQRIADFRQAARNVIDAGGDGVEIHGAHGYLIDQFTRDSCNNRTDRWGGSVENRNRFLLEIVKAVTEEIGADKVGLRLSPFGTFQDCYSNEPDTWEQTGAILSSLKAGGFKLAYISWVEPRFDPSLYGKTPPPGHPNPFGNRKQTILTFLQQWQNYTPFLVAGGYTGDNASEALDEKYKDYDVAIAYGRYFISNPDLVFRVKNKIEFTPYNRPTFFIPKSVEGYNDYEFSKEALEAEIRPYEA